ncbi:cation diffusion facilitator family transporter [Hahella sp. KA22]|uniref:cation diffusion facilitator family transporter n=1 Tax=Hahella sp. KA22 TaxID=1628392 RepID=UPI000FDDC389|nr:cation diffusion facilitator family transporter [Hahella sp. KA22]AZZ91871.1 cation transporter [Hahella sp. KA22]QAY55242.1 cation diffusion facilitator family transporter [Hahella sp. KA22]
MASGSKKVIYAALIGNAMVALTKFAAAAFTGSSAMFSEGVHSVVDTGNQVLLLHGMKRSQRPASEDFPFGHGKEIYFWSFIVAILIFALGAGISIYEGIEHILHPQVVENPVVNYIVLSLAILFEGFAFFMAIKEFRNAKGQMGYVEAVQRGKDPSMFVVLFEDAAAMLGLVVALGGIVLGQVTGNPVYDGVASVIIGCILGLTALWLAVETKGLLIGESANKKVVKGIREMTQAIPGVEHVNEVLTMHMGPDFVLVNISVDFKDSISAGEIETRIASLDEQIKSSFPECKRIFVEAESRRKKAAVAAPTVDV